MPLLAPSRVPAGRTLPAPPNIEHRMLCAQVPRIGGRELDLQQLYRNVTALGGCEKVIACKQWLVGCGFVDSHEGASALTGPRLRRQLGFCR